MQLLKEKLVFLIIALLMTIVIITFGLDSVFEKGILSNIFSELVGILFTSFVVVWHLNRFGQPELYISPIISQNFNKEKNQFEYYIKVINKTKYDIIIIQHGLYYFKKLDYSLEKFYGLKMYLEPVNFIQKYSRKDRNFSYCKRFLIFTDLENYKMDSDVDYFRFVIVANNSNTDKSKVFKQEFKKTDIKKGKFVTGNCFDIINDCSTS